MTLHVSLDELVFDEAEGPIDQKMKLLFEAAERLKEDEQLIIRELLEGIIVKYEARSWTRAATGRILNQRPDRNILEMIDTVIQQHAS